MLSLSLARQRFPNHVSLDQFMQNGTIKIKERLQDTHREVSKS